MKNIILFFLLLAYTTSFAQYGKKHASNSHLSLSVTPKTNSFGLKSPVIDAAQSSAYWKLYPAISTVPKTDDIQEIRFRNMYWVDPMTEGNGHLHSTYVYDLRGNIVTSKLSYSFSKKH